MNLNLLDPKLIALVGAVIVIVAVLAWLYVRRRRSTTEELRQKFGPEYERAVLKHGSERKAEAKLADREKRVEKLNIRDLDPMEHERFLKRWESVQSRFVDSPKGAVTEADDLVTALERAIPYLRGEKVSTGRLSLSDRAPALQFPLSLGRHFLAVTWSAILSYSVFGKML